MKTPVDIIHFVLKVGGQKSYISLDDIYVGKNV